MAEELEQVVSQEVVEAPKKKKAAAPKEVTTVPTVSYFISQMYKGTDLYNVCKDLNGNVSIIESFLPRRDAFYKAWKANGEKGPIREDLA